MSGSAISFENQPEAIGFVPDNGTGTFQGQVVGPKQEFFTPVATVLPYQSGDMKSMEMGVARITEALDSDGNLTEDLTQIYSAKYSFVSFFNYARPTSVFDGTSNKTIRDIGTLMEDKFFIIDFTLPLILARVTAFRDYSINPKKSFGDAAIMQNVDRDLFSSVFDSVDNNSVEYLTPGKQGLTVSGDNIEDAYKFSLSDIGVANGVITGKVASVDFPGGGAHITVGDWFFAGPPDSVVTKVVTIASASGCTPKCINGEICKDGECVVPETGRCVPDCKGIRPVCSNGQCVPRGSVTACDGEDGRDICDTSKAICVDGACIPIGTQEFCGGRRCNSQQICIAERCVAVDPGVIEDCGELCTFFEECDAGTCVKSSIRFRQFILLITAILIISVVAILIYMSSRRTKSQNDFINSIPNIALQ